MNLEEMLIALASLTALAAAARSTWSPCGLSMLSSLTPFGERTRGHRYPVTAAWFVAGATVGGATLGAVAVVVALASSAAGVARHPLPVALIAAAIALLGVAIDAGVFGEVLPVIRRQVNDRWLSRYRVWVYAGGFGWQVGSGISTYVMTSAVFVFVALAAASGQPVAAMCVATGFGAARGGAVLLTSRASDPHALRALHQKLDRATEPVRWIAIASQGIAAVVLFGYVSPVCAAGCAALMATALRVQTKSAAARVAGR
jgi:MFS family permease